MTTHISLVKEAHKIIAANLPTGGTAIDATVGNGYDSVFLAEQVGAEGLVYGFDIQQTALESARTRLERANLLERVKLIHAGHESMAAQIEENTRGKVHSIMFNLGYLPGHDKTVITRKNTTLKALNAAVRLISSGGVVTVVAYPGHEGGRPELVAVSDWCNKLGNGFVVNRLCRNERSPCLFSIFR